MCIVVEIGWEELMSNIGQSIMKIKRIKEWCWNICIHLRETSKTERNSWFCQAGSARTVCLGLSVVGLLIMLWVVTQQAFWTIHCKNKIHSCHIKCIFCVFVSSASYLERGLLRAVWLPVYTQGKKHPHITLLFSRLNTSASSLLVIFVSLFWNHSCKPMSVFSGEPTPGLTNAEPWLVFAFPLPAGNAALNVVQEAVNLLCLQGHITGLWSACCFVFFMFLKVCLYRAALQSGGDIQQVLVFPLCRTWIFLCLTWWNSFLSKSKWWQRQLILTFPGTELKLINLS